MSRGTHVERVSFEFEGHPYTIFKRGDGSANFEIDFYKYRQRVQRSLETPIKKVALERAKRLIGLVKAERWELLEASKLRAVAPAAVEYAAIGRICETYRVNAPKDELGEKTIKGNIGALRIIIRTALGKPADAVDGLSGQVLTGALVRDYKKAVLASIAADEDECDELAQRAKRTANSYLGQGRSLFTDRAREHYRDAGLVLPDVREFMEVPGFFRVGKMEYNAPPDEVIARTFVELERLREEDLNAYLAICLACGAGLRKGEVAQARRSWFVVTNGVARLQAKIETKNGQFINLPLLGEWWARLELVFKEAWRGGEAADCFILQGNRQEREEDVFRRIGPWMRGLGWETQKTFHEFRAYVGSMIAMDSRYGMEIASMFLRHHSVDFTRRYYLRYVKLKAISLKSFGSAAA